MKTIEDYRADADRLFPLINRLEGQSDRNKELAKCVLHGMTYTEAGRAYGISGGRAAQILNGVLRDALRPRATPSEIADGSADIRHCGFSVRTRNSLIYNGVNTVAELHEFIAQHGTDYLRLRWPNFGKVSQQEIDDFLHLEEQPRAKGDAAAYRAGLDDAVRVLESIKEEGGPGDWSRAIKSIQALG